MEEVYKFFSLLKKHRFTIVVIPLLTIVVTFFLVKNLPDSFISQTQIATGIVDNTNEAVIKGESSAKSWAEVNQKFSNLIEMMKLKKITDQVSYKLIIHDLSGNKPFRPLSSDLIKSTSGERKLIIDNFKAKYNKNEALNLNNKDQYKLYKILLSAEYDSESITNNLKINRAGDSDFIKVEFDSENPELSAFVVNILCDEFIKYYTSVVRSNQLKANIFLDRLMFQKRNELNSKVNALRDYKIKNRVLNLDEQSSQLYAQIIDYNNRKQQVLKDISANAGAVKEIEARFNPQDRGYLESTLTKINQRLISTKEDLRTLYDLYVQNDFEPSYRASIDSLQRILTSEINKSADQYINSPLAAKQALIEQKILLEVQLDLSRYSMNTIERALAGLNAQFDGMVPHEAEVQSLERDVEISGREYLEALNKSNQSNMESGFSIKLNQVQSATPGLAQPSKKMLLVILSGIISFIFCVIVIFILFLLDHSIMSAKDLAAISDTPVLGIINQVKGSDRDLNEIWLTSENKQLNKVKNQIRSIRFEVDDEYSNGIITITSMAEREGKTFLALNMAHAWQKTSKKVLIIDGNFSNPEISRLSKSNLYLEDCVNDPQILDSLGMNNNIAILANKGTDTSLYEITGREDFDNFMLHARRIFDIVIIDAPPLSKMNKSKEWLGPAGVVIVVFESGKSMDDEARNHLKFLSSYQKTFSGWVLNKVPESI